MRWSNLHEPAERRKCLTYTHRHFGINIQQPTNNIAVTCNDLQAATIGLTCIDKNVGNHLHTSTAGDNSNYMQPRVWWSQPHWPTKTWSCRQQSPPRTPNNDLQASPNEPTLTHKDIQRRANDMQRPTKTWNGLTDDPQMLARPLQLPTKCKNVKYIVNR